jgi:hypothetical protein
VVIDWDHQIPPIKENKMLSSRTIKFLTAAVLIAVAVLATTSMVNPVVGETMSGSNAQGLAQYHQSERAGQTAEMGLAKYYRSERAPTLNTSQEVGLVQYHRSERGLNAPDVDGLAIYFSSERGFPIRDLGAFNSYQRSEWFGQ